MLGVDKDKVATVYTASGRERSSTAKPNSMTSASCSEPPLHAKETSRLWLSSLHLHETVGPAGHWKAWGLVAATSVPKRSMAATRKR